MASKVHVAFALGLMIAKRAHGISRKDDLAVSDAIASILQQVASGELTLLNTPEETIADLPPPPPELAAQVPEAIRILQDELAAQLPGKIRQAMREQREVAAELLELMKVP